MERLFERDHDVGFHVASALRASRSLPEAAAAEPARSAATAEERFKEITEAGSTELKFHSASIARSVAAEAPARLLRTPSGRRLKSSRLVPVRTQLIIFFPLFRIAEDFVSLVELLKFLLRRPLVLVDVGMVFARQLAKRPLDFVVARCLGNAQRFVIISELDCHLFPRSSAWERACATRRMRSLPWKMRRHLRGHEPRLAQTTTSRRSCRAPAAMPPLPPHD